MLFRHGIPTLIPLLDHANSGRLRAFLLKSSYFVELRERGMLGHAVSLPVSAGHL